MKRYHSGSKTYKVKVPKGVLAWLEYKTDGYDTAEFIEDSVVEVEEYNEYWYRTIENASALGFPLREPVKLLISNKESVTIVE